MSDIISIESERVTEEHVPPVKRTIQQLENQPRPRFPLEDNEDYTPSSTPASSRRSTGRDQGTNVKPIGSYSPGPKLRNGDTKVPQRLSPASSKHKKHKLKPHPRPTRTDTADNSRRESSPYMEPIRRETDEPSPEFNVDVDSLNHCLRDIEEFANEVTPVLTSLIDFRDQVKKGLSKKKREKRRDELVAQIPPAIEFIDAFQKYKLALNLVAHLRDYLSNPSAQELPTTLLGPFDDVLQVCNLSHGEIAAQVVSPLFTTDAKRLMNENLTPEQLEMIRGLGNAWTLDEDQWTGDPPLPYVPRFSDGYVPYPDGMHVHFFKDRPTRVILEDHSHLNVEANTNHDIQEPQNADDNDSSVLSSDAEEKLTEELLAIQRQTLTLLREKEERMDGERERIDKERKRIDDERHKLDRERVHLDEERVRLIETEEAIRRASQQSNGDKERLLLANSEPAEAPIPHLPEPDYDIVPKLYTPEKPLNRNEGIGADHQRIFLNDLIARKAKVGQVTFGLAGQDPKQLSVEKGEFVEVLEDNRNWWRCKNAHGRVGYVPYTVLTVLKATAPTEVTPALSTVQTNVSSTRGQTNTLPQQQSQQPQVVVERIVERVPVVYREQRGQRSAATGHPPARMYPPVAEKPRPISDVRADRPYKGRRPERRPSYSSGRHHHDDYRPPKRHSPHDRHRDRRRSPSPARSPPGHRRHSPRGRAVSPVIRHHERMLSPRRMGRSRDSDEADTSPGGWNPEMMGPNVPNAVRDRIGRFGWSYI